MRAREPEETAPPRAHLFAGGALLLAAAVAVVWQTPRPGGSSIRPADSPSASSSGSHGPGAEARRTIASLGPLRTGDTLGDGWKIDRIEASVDEVRVDVSRGDAKLTLGLAAPDARTDTPLVPMADVYIWYSGQPSRATSLEDLIVALASRLREAAGGEPVHRRVLAWSAAAPEAKP